MINFGLVDVVDVEAIGLAGERTFRLRARAGVTRAALWMEKEQLVALGRALSQLLADRAKRRDEPLPEPPAMGEFGVDPDVEMQVVRIGLDYSDEENGRVRILVDDQDALERGDTPAFRMEMGRTPARVLVGQISSVVAAGRPRCLLCGRPLEGDGRHFCPSSNGHSREEEIPFKREDEDFS
jgi:uncharacterized repeat protein (TIGR03847 family)